MELSSPPGVEAPHGGCDNDGEMCDRPGSTLRSTSRLDLVAVASDKLPPHIRPIAEERYLNNTPIWAVMRQREMKKK